ncbi:MAG: hypothetical protein EOM54_05245 [Clostridia bacterium]|nr:hypothetical protein [Clostridia bacterium]
MLIFCPTYNDIEDVRVTKLCEKAGVSRRAFYNYFDDIYGVVYWIREVIRTESICRIGIDLGWHEGHKRMFEQYREYMVFKKNLNRYGRYMFVRDLLLENIRKAGKLDLTEAEFTDLDFYTFAVMADICQHYIPEWLIELFGA